MSSDTDTPKSQEADPTESADPVVEDTPVLIVNPLEKELNDTMARLRTVSSAYKQLQDDMHAFRERQARQLAVREEMIKGDAVGKLFEPLENLRRTIDAAERAKLDRSLIEGMELVYRSFLEGFHALGLEEVGREGDAFDPQVHEALTAAPVPTPEQDGRVLQVYSKGYRIGTRVIRPARVIVGQHTPAAGEA